MMAERAWAYAMQLRQEANTEPRKKYHLLGRLRKAVVYALQFQQLCEVSKDLTLAARNLSSFASFVKLNRGFFGKPTKKKDRMYATHVLDRSRAELERVDETVHWIIVSI